MEKTDFRKIRNHILTLLLVVLLTVSMLFLVLKLRGYVEESVHNDRKTYLTAQTDTVAKLLNSTISQYSDYINVCSNVIDSNLEDGVVLRDFIDDFHDKLYLMNARLIFVDRNCTWYGEDGTTGRITSMLYYTSSTPDFATYMTMGVDSDIESIVFRRRLKNPKTVITDDGEVEISYCAVIFYMDRFKSLITEAFPFECNSFIADAMGLMIFKDFAVGILVDGSNLFFKYRKVDFLYGSEGQSYIDRIKNKEITVGEFLLNSKNYFVCTSPLDVNDWTVCFVLESDQLSAGSYINGLLIYVLTIGFIMLVIVVIFIIMNMRRISNARMLDAQIRVNEMLEQASAAKSDFLSNMSHDIRTPINGILGMVLIAKKEKNGDRTNDCLEKIHGASQYLLALVNDVLDMSSIESGKIVITNKPVDLEYLCDECESVILGQINGRNLTFHPCFSGVRHRFVMADEIHMGQILINILSNAVKYTKDGGEIWFSMEEKDFDGSKATISFSVQDTGIGMSKEFLEHIWDRFSQEQGGSRTTYKGTGLGMSITKSLVDLMGGRISVESEYGVGSRFTVDIPFEITDEEVGDASRSGVPVDISGTRILLVEDNDLNIEIATELLESENVIVTTARDGAEAVNTFIDSPVGSFDMILMDIMMPVMDGLEATRRIRKLHRPDASIPIIAMTAKAFDKDIRDSIDAGMNEHLTKPINMKSVVDVISRFRNRGVQI